MRGTDYIKPEKQLAEQRKQTGDHTADENGLQGYKVGPMEMAVLKDDQEDSSQEVLNIDQTPEKRDQKAAAMMHTGSRYAPQTPTSGAPNAMPSSIMDASSIRPCSPVWKTST